MVDGKCETLVRSRMVEDSPGHFASKRLREPEHCGDNGVLYEVRRGDKKGCISAAFVKQFSCDKHKAKAGREGMVLTPA